jgi:ATP-dependent helicase/nuclease subunit B
MRSDPWGPPLLLLVPEQATHQTERALLSSGASGAMRAQVMSFGRLAGAVLSAAGSARQTVDEVGRHMLIAAVVEQEREGLGVFGASARRPGFISSLARTFAELSAQRVGSRQIDVAIARLSGVSGGDPAGAREAGPDMLRAKLADVGRVLARFRERLHQAYTDPHDTLELAADQLAATGLLRGAEVFVDGFAGFTPQEHELLAAIAGEAADVWLALCIDPALAGGAAPEAAGPALAGAHRLFAPTRKTYWQVRSMAAQRGLRIGQHISLPSAGQPTRFSASPPLARLEQVMGGEPDGGDARHAPPAAGDHLRLVQAADQRREVAAVCSYMLRLARDRGYAWRDMAVIASDLESYHDVLRTTMDEYGIPAFIDRRQKAPYHPVVEFVRSALEIAAQGWQAWSVTRWLKTDLGPLGRAEVDELETYLLAHGIRGAKAWTRHEDWAYWPRDSRGRSEPADPAAEGPVVKDAAARRNATLAAVNGCRRRVAAVLAPFHDELRRPPGAAAAPGPGGGQPTVAGMVRALVGLLEAAGVPATLSRWAAEAEAAGRPGDAQEHREVWRGVSGLLTQAHAALGQAAMSLEEFASVIEAGLESLTLGMVPPSLDQVVCGSIERSRQPELRALFIIGADQGAFPGKPGEDLVFDDADRAALAGASLELAPTARERSLHEEYLAYIAVTRASELLWVSWPQRSVKGAGKSPSPLIQRLREAFPDLAVTLPDDLELVWRPGQLVRGVAASLANLPHGLAPAAPWRQAYGVLAEAGRQQQAAAAGLLATAAGPLATAPGQAGTAATQDGPAPAGAGELTPEHARQAVAGLSWANTAASIGPDLGRELWRRPVAGSASRFERYAACPFAHFAQYGLRLAPRQAQEIKAPEIGTFYHDVLHAYYKGLLDEGKGPGGISLQERASRLAAAVEAVAPALGAEVLMEQPRYQHLRRILARTVGRTLEWLTLQDSRSSFVPVGLEQGFGFPRSLAGPLVVAGARVRGVIDRLDLARRADGAMVLRVIDYKSGKPEFEIADVAYGISLQLLTYLVAAETVLDPGLSGATVAALLLVPVHDDMVVAAGPDDDRAPDKQRRQRIPDGLVLAEREVVELLDARSVDRDASSRLLPVSLNAGGEARGKGAVTKGQLKALARYLEAKVAEIAGALAAGEVAISPWRQGSGKRACRYCDFHPVCAFDPGLAGNDYRELAPLKRDAAWKVIEDASGLAPGAAARE